MKRFFTLLLLALLWVYAYQGHSFAQVILRSSPAYTLNATPNLVLRVGQYDQYNITLAANGTIQFSLPVFTGIIPFRLKLCENGIGGFTPTFNSTDSAVAIVNLANAATINTTPNVCQVELWSYRHEDGQIAFEGFAPASATATTINAGLAQSGSMVITALPDPSAPSVTVNTTGSTSYTYYLVGHDGAAACGSSTNEGKSNVSAGKTITNGASPPNNTITIPSTVGYVAWDVLKNATNVSLATCVSAGGSVIDTGQATATYIPPSYNSTGEIRKASYPGVINVQATGAVGDGVTDDGPAFNRALAGLLPSTQGVGNAVGTVMVPTFLPNGKRAAYLITTPINATGISSGQLLGWSGGHFVGGGQGNAELLCNTGASPCIDRSGSNNFRIANLHLDGATPTNPSCIGVLDARGATVGSSFAQFNTVDHVSMAIKDSGTCVANYGSVGIYDYGAEIATIYSTQISARIPLFISGRNTPAVTSPYITLIASPTSTSEISLYHTTLSNTGVATTGNGGSGIFFDGNSQLIWLHDTQINDAVTTGYALQFGNPSSVQELIWPEASVQDAAGQTQPPIYLNANSNLQYSSINGQFGVGNIAEVQFDASATGVTCPNIKRTVLNFWGTPSAGTSIMGIKSTANCTSTTPLLGDNDTINFNGYDTLSLNFVGIDTNLTLTGQIVPSRVTLPTGSSYKTPDAFVATAPDGNTNLGMNAVADPANQVTGFGVGVLNAQLLPTNLSACSTASGGTGGCSDTAFGDQALKNATTGYQNNAFGFQALYTLTTGQQNSAFGNQAGAGITTGAANTAIGLSALPSDTTGSFNTAVGANALFNSNSNNNSAVGLDALNTLTTGANNTAMGFKAGLNVTTGSNNLILEGGSSSNNTDPITTGSTNIALAPGIGVSNSLTQLSATGNSQIDIGDALVGVIGAGFGPPKLASPPAAIGAGKCEFFAVAGTAATSCKIQVICGASATPVTLADNVGSGC